jgi:dTDP-L-rhamnose 4-epimerase
VASLFRSALAGGHPPQVFEDGGQTRDFVHVRDVARANVLALTRPDIETAGGAYNVASGTPHTVGELAEALSATLAPHLTPVVTGRWRLGDVRHVVASPARAAAALGFHAEVSFEDGMAELAGGTDDFRP